MIGIVTAVHPEGNFSQITAFAAAQRPQGQAAESSAAGADQDFAIVDGSSTVASSRRLADSADQAFTGQHPHGHRSLGQLAHQGQTVFFNRQAEHPTDVADKSHRSSFLADRC